MEFKITELDFLNQYTLSGDDLLILSDITDLTSPSGETKHISIVELVRLLNNHSICSVPVPTLTPSVSPSVSFSATPTPTQTATPTVTPTHTPTPSVSPSPPYIPPTPSPTPSFTPTMTVTPTNTPTLTPSKTPTQTPTNTPTPTRTMTPTPSQTRTPRPTVTPTSSARPTPTPTPSVPVRNVKFYIDTSGSMRNSISAIMDAITKVKTRIGGTPGVSSVNFTTERTYQQFAANEISIVLQDESSPYQTIATAHADRIAVASTNNHAVVVANLTTSYSDSLYKLLNDLKGYNGKPTSQYTVHKANKEDSAIYYYNLFAEILKLSGINLVPESITKNNNIQQVVPQPTNVSVVSKNTRNVRHIPTTPTPTQNQSVVFTNTRNVRHLPTTPTPNRAGVLINKRNSR